MNKLNGKLIIIFVFLLFVVSIGAVSATDDSVISAPDNSTVIQNTQINENLDNNLLSVGTDSNPVLNGSNLTKYYKGNEKYTISLTKDGTPLAGETVAITINGETYDLVTNNNGRISMEIGLNAGTYIVSSVYNGSYGNATLNNTITVLTTIQGSETELYYCNGTSYSVCVIDSQGKVVTSGNVRFNINGVFYDMPINNGTASLPIGLNPNTYIITALNPTNGEMTSNNITVRPTISGKDTTLYYRNGSGYTVTVLDGQGNLAKNGNVEMNIHGVFYKVAVENGTATLPINLRAGSYIITAKNLANGEMTSNTITVKPTISGEDTTLYFCNGTGYVATVLDGQGTPAKNGTVEMNIDGVLYEINITNGTATLPINLRVGSYIITAKNLANGEMTSNRITVKTTILAEDQYIYFQSGESFKATILDGQGTPAKNGTVEMNIHGETYKVNVTNGTASLPINLNKGSYIITTKNLANNETASNTVTVVTNTIVGKDTTIIYKTTKYTVYVFDAAGKPLNGVNVSFRVNGVEYNITAVNGSATLPIELDYGKYDITATNLVTKESVTNKLNVIASIYANNVVMRYGDGSTWDILILDANGKPAPGEQVTIYANQYITISQTGDDGMYHYPINLEKGYIYNVVAIHGNYFSTDVKDSVSRTITVYP